MQDPLLNRGSRPTFALLNKFKLNIKGTHKGAFFLKGLIKVLFPDQSTEFT